MNIDKKHICEPMLGLSGSEAVKITIEQNNYSWSLMYKTFATDYDVKSGEAETAGEETGEISISIHYCPFCGKLLKKVK